MHHVPDPSDHEIQFQRKSMGMIRRLQPHNLQGKTDSAGSNRKAEGNGSLIIVKTDRCYKVQRKNFFLAMAVKTSAMDI